MKNLSDLGTPIFQVKSGSSSYGTFIEGKSDLDKRGIFIPKREFFYGFHSVDEFTDKEEEDSVWFSLHKFVKLALDCNPNVVEQLFAREEEILFMNKIGKELVDMRHEFLTKNAYGRFGGYAFSQLKRMNSKGNHNKHGSHADIIQQYGYDTKHAMHLVRLLEMGIEILSKGQLNTYRPNKDELLAIRHGKYKIEEIYQLADKLNEQLEEAMLKSNIPSFPDFDKINKWVIKIIDEVHTFNKNCGNFRGVQFNILPLEYEMIDKCTILLVSNKLQRIGTKSDAIGVAVPYKDWYTGLREFKNFKFEKTSIDELRRVIDFTRKANPKMIDMIFASDKHVLFSHPMANELKEKLITLIKPKEVYNKAINFAKGNLREMENWERMKREWNVEKETNSKLSVYPPVPKKTDTENASYMTKFGYDTLKSVEIYHTLVMSIEFLENGTIEDSRKWEPELYSIKHRKYETFEDFKGEIQILIEKLEKSYQNHVPITNINEKELEKWLVDFITRFHSTI